MQPSSSRPSAPNQPESMVFALGSFFAVALLGFAGQRVPGLATQTFLIGSMGATTVIVFGLPESPMARARAVVGGHVISALVGVTVATLLPGGHWYASALSVTLALLAMRATNTLHPPGGATALIAVIGPSSLRALGYGYVVAPVLIGAATLFVVGACTRWLAGALRGPRWSRGHADSSSPLAEEIASAPST